MTGFWGPDALFHWSERAMRRTSIRNFVWKIAGRAVPQIGSPRWLAYWRRVEWAKDALRKLHVRLPASAWDQQRATLRAMLTPAGAGVFFDPVAEPGREVTRRAAMRWAKKPVDPGAGAAYDG